MKPSASSSISLPISIACLIRPKVTAAYVTCNFLTAALAQENASYQNARTIAYLSEESPFWKRGLSGDNMVLLHNTFHTLLHPVLILFCLSWIAISPFATCRHGNNQEVRICHCMRAPHSPLLLEPQMSAPELKGWHSRSLAHPHPDPHSFTPHRADLELVMLSNGMLDEGFILAIFS